MYACFVSKQTVFTIVYGLYLYYYLHIHEANNSNQRNLLSPDDSNLPSEIGVPIYGRRRQQQQQPSNQHANQNREMAEEYNHPRRENENRYEIDNPEAYQRRPFESDDENDENHHDIENDNDNDNNIDNNSNQNQQRAHPLA